MPNRTVFFVSDGTGITAETFGNSILAQFPARPRHVRRPFIDSVDKALGVLQEINEAADREGKRPIVFVTLVNDEVRRVLTTETCKGLVLDMFSTFVQPLEEEFGVKSNHRIGRFSDAAKSEELDKTRAAVHSLVERLRSLSEFDDPRVEVSRGVMIAGWDYVQHLGLATSRQRLGSSPVSLAGLSLAEVVWQSRNQSEHVRSPKRQVVDAFEAIMNAHPTSFGFSRAAIPRPLVEATLKKQAWAREVLVLLGWTSRSAAVSGLLSIR